MPVACKGRKGRKRAGISGLWHREGKVGSFPIPAVLESATMNQFFSIPHSAPCWHRAALTLPGAPILHKGGDAGLVPRAWAQLGTSQARCRQSRADNKPQHPRQGLIKDSEWFFSTQITSPGWQGSVSRGDSHLGVPEQGRGARAACGAHPPVLPQRESPPSLSHSKANPSVDGSWEQPELARL